MYLLFDIGGTKSRFALSKDGTSYDEPVIIDTPKSYPHAILAFDDAVKKLTKGKKILKAVGGFAGTVVDKRVFWSPNLPDFQGKLIGYELERIFGVEPRLENDADLAALGEATAGAGRGFNIVAYMTISTGVGGGLVIDGKIQKKKYGHEPGYQIMNYKTGEVLHDMISGTALEKKYKKPAKEIKDPEVYEWIAQLLGVALANMIIHWSPDIIVLGGSISRDIDMGEVEHEVKKNLRIFPQAPVVRRAELDAYNGIAGALALLKSEL